MSDTTTAVTVRYAVRSDPGHGRTTNEDVAYAGDHLLAVADGTRGPGATASAAAVNALKPLELADKPAADLLPMLAATVNDVDRAVRAIATASAQPVTTLTALLRRGSQLALVHIGDTRAYLLRGGELTQLTQDHTWVRTQVDHGKLSPEQAATHPQRAMLTRALGAGTRPVEADLALRTALPGDLGVATTVQRLLPDTGLSHPLELLSAFLPERLNRVSTSDQRRAGRQHHRVVGIHGRHGRRVASIEGLMAAPQRVDHCRIALVHRPRSISR